MVIRSVCLCVINEYIYYYTKQSIYSYVCLSRLLNRTASLIFECTSVCTHTRIHILCMHIFRIHIAKVLYPSYCTRGRLIYASTSTCNCNCVCMHLPTYMGVHDESENITKINNSSVQMKFHYSKIIAGIVQ